MAGKYNCEHEIILVKISNFKLMQAYLLNGLVVLRFTTMTHLSQFVKDKINLNSMLIEW